MRILITTDVVGGVWQFTHELTAGLLREGTSVALVSFGGKPAPEHLAQCACLAAEYGDRFLYESSPVALEWMQQNEGAFFEAAPLLLQLARDCDADLLHSSQFCFGVLPLEIPKVITAHSDVLSWADACRDAPLEDSPWLRQYRRLVSDGLCGAMSVVAPTRWMLHALEQNFPLRAAATVIPNGRTLAPPSAVTRPLQAVTAGRLWDEAKDVRLLAAVSAPFPLYVAGETEHDGRSASRQLGSAALLGRLPESELLELFRNSAIYICTSRYEPFGLAPLEAALCGCAVLARDIPSLREVWQEGARYFSDAPSLETLLHEFASDPQLLAAAQTDSLNRARLFTAERMVSLYRAHYAHALNEAEARTYAA
jgi:glycogen synthase